MQPKTKLISRALITGILFSLLILPVFAQDAGSGEGSEIWLMEDGVETIRIGGTVTEPEIKTCGRDIVKTGQWHYTSETDYQDFPPVYISVIKKVAVETNTQKQKEYSSTNHHRRSLSSRSGTQNVKYVRKRVQEDISPIILKNARKYNVSPYIIKAVIQVESSFNPSAISRSGACGLMQLKPGTAYDMGVRNYWNPEKNIEAGTKYLRLMIDMFGSLRVALAGYNQGPGAVQRAGCTPPNNTADRYIWKVYKALENPRQ